MAPQRRASGKERHVGKINTIRIQVGSVDRELSNNIPHHFDSFKIFRVSDDRSI